MVITRMYNAGSLGLTAGGLKFRSYALVIMLKLSCSVPISVEESLQLLLKWIHRVRKSIVLLLFFLHKKYRRNPSFFGIHLYVYLGLRFIESVTTLLTTIERKLL